MYTWGTLPTPDDPLPSNVVIKTYSDGYYDRRVPPATPKVIAEFDAAIASAPECAALREEFAFSLRLAGMREAALEQEMAAKRIRATTNYGAPDLQTEK